MREFGSEFYFPPHGNGFLDSFKVFRTVKLLSTGREALGLVAESIKPAHKVILIPAYSCASMTQAFIYRDWSIFYYKINTDFSADEKNLIELCKKHSPTAVLLMNFFGVAGTELIAEKIKLHFKNIILIEDFTHVLLSPIIFSNKYIDFYVGSIRKWFGINDGAVLLSNIEFEPIVFGNNNDFLKYRIEGQLLKFKYDYIKDSGLKVSYLNLLKRAELYATENNMLHSISESSMDVLKCINIESISFSRKENFRHLYNIIKELNKIKIPIKLKDILSEIPFSLPIMVSNRDFVQKELSARGLYSSVLWPIDNEARKVCSFSANMADNMLSIPIDQRYNYEDIESIGQIINKVHEII